MKRALLLFLVLAGFCTAFASESSSPHIFDVLINPLLGSDEPSVFVHDFYATENVGAANAPGDGEGEVPFPPGNQGQPDPYTVKWKVQYWGHETDVGDVEMLSQIPGTPVESEILLGRLSPLHIFNFFMTEDFAGSHSVPADSANNPWLFGAASLWDQFGNLHDEEDTIDVWPLTPQSIGLARALYKQHAFHAGEFCEWYDLSFGFSNDQNAPLIAKVYIRTIDEDKEFFGNIAFPARSKGRMAIRAILPLSHRMHNQGNGDVYWIRIECPDNPDLDSHFLLPGYWQAP